MDLCCFRFDHLVILHDDQWHLDVVSLVEPTQRQTVLLPVCGLHHVVRTDPSHRDDCVVQWGLSPRSYGADRHRRGLGWHRNPDDLPAIQGLWGSTVVILYTIWEFVSSSNVLTAMAGGLTSAGTGIFAWLASRRKSTKDFTVSLTSGFDVLTQRLQQDNNELRVEIQELRRELQRLRNALRMRSRFTPDVNRASRSDEDL